MAKNTQKEKVTNEPSNASPFKRKKAVTVPTLKLEFDRAYYIRFVGEIEVKPSKGKNGEVRDIKVAKVIDLEGDVTQEKSLVLPIVLEKNLTENYSTLEGKSFEIMKSKKEGKEYNAFSIYEIEA